MSSVVKKLAAFAVGFGVGYIVVTKVAPILQAKVEAFDLDTTWAVYDDMHNWGDE